MRLLASLAVFLAVASSASAQMRITEWAYSANDGEFIEFTNIGVSAINMAGWSYDDDSRLPGTVDLSAFGIVNPGESVILTEANATAFATAWSLTGVDIIGGNTTNLGRNDEINLYDDGGALVDRLTYGDQNFPGTIRTQNISGWTQAGLGLNDVSLWQLSVVGDAQNSYTSSLGDIGNPGSFVPVPEPTTLLLGGLGLGGVLLGARRARKGKKLIKTKK